MNQSVNPALIGQGDQVGQLRALLDRQRQAFNARPTSDHRERIARLDALAAGIGRHQQALVDAVMADFGHRSRHETLISEVISALGEIRFTKAKLKGWMKQRRVRPTVQSLGSVGRILYQPKGVIGIMGAWNYPAALCFSPMIGAIAAGNHMLVKPSDLTPRTAEVIRQLVAETFEESYCAVVTGDVGVSVLFSTLPFDHLLYTGGTAVGCQVMQAAARNLTPVTLEMGGKSPTLIGERFPMARAVQSILMGKLLNAGQTCIAPDYLLLPKARLQEFLEVATAAILERYPRVVDNPDITWIINERHHQRILGLIEDARDKGARIHELNPGHAEIPAGVRVIAPTLLYEVTDQMRVMQEEIFGPLLPIVTYDSLDQAIDYVNRRPRPLALYLFEEDDDRIRRVVNGTISGGVCVNDTMLHIAHQNLPFGGIGPSGLGAYHGFDGFVEFSHKKAVLYQGRFSPAALLKPPYNERALKVLNWVARRLA